MLRTLRQWLVLVVVMSAIVLGGCLPQEGAQSSAASPSPTPTASVPVTPASSPQTSGIPRLNGKATVAIVVKGSTITAELDGTSAPLTAGNFVDLVQRGVYNGLVFHRVVREPQPFVVQGGDPQSKNPNFPTERLGTGSFIDPATGQPRYVPLEILPVGAKTPVYHKTLEEAGITAKPKLTHKRGALAMARSQPPDSASSQFYITLADINFLDGNYAVFGYVTKGMATVDKIQQGDRIESAKVVEGLENLKTDAKT